MRVLYIIPAAFNYFDDIRLAAFKILDCLDTFNVEAEAFTLQYGATPLSESDETPRQHKTARGNASQFIGMTSLDLALASFNTFDILHLHTPFLGAAGRILHWKKEHPGTPLVVTYYRSDRLIDLYSSVLYAYTAYYLPKIMAAADVVTCVSDMVGEKLAQSRVGKNASRIITVDESPYFMGTDLTQRLQGVQLNDAEMVAYKYTLLYTDLTTTQ